IASTEATCSAVRCSESSTGITELRSATIDRMPVTSHSGEALHSMRMTGCEYEKLIHTPSHGAQSTETVNPSGIILRRQRRHAPARSINVAASNNGSLQSPRPRNCCQKFRIAVKGSLHPSR
ncbi:hypothetical protein L917_01167, partial [Phytophthora nicotianae]